MTAFHFTRAMKATQMELARGYLNAYIFGDTKDPAQLQVCFGHLRAMLAIEDSVEKTPGSFRATAIEMLKFDTGALIIELNRRHYVHKGEDGMLLLLDEYEEKHNAAIYS